MKGNQNVEVCIMLLDFTGKLGLDHANAMAAARALRANGLWNNYWNNLAA